MENQPVQNQPMKSLAPGAPAEDLESPESMDHQPLLESVIQDRRLAQQLRFLAEVDKLKQVRRRSLLLDRSRRENSAEHSWHLGVMALVLAEYANDRNLDLGKVLQMVAIHDLVEIYAGDTFCYDANATVGQQEREREAARRLFALLPDDQAARLRALWEEFEAQKTPEAAFAAALDRLHPVLHNYCTQGVSWREHQVSRDQVLDRNRNIAQGARPLWQLVQSLVDDAVQRGYLSK